MSDSDSAYDIVVVGPVDGLYHLGYFRADNPPSFYSMTQFVSKTLAETMAWKMGRDRVLVAKKEF